LQRYVVLRGVQCRGAKGNMGYPVVSQYPVIGVDLAGNDNIFIQILCICHKTGAAKEKQDDSK